MTTRHPNKKIRNSEYVGLAKSHIYNSVISQLNFKRIILFFPILLSAAMVFWAARDISIIGITSTNLIVGIIFYAIFSVLIGLFLIFENKKSFIIGSSLFLILLFLIVFVRNFKPIYFLTALLFAGLFLSGVYLAWRRVKREIEERIKLEPYWYFKKSLPLLLTGFALFISYPFYSQQVLLDLELPRPVFDYFSESLINSFSQLAPLEINSLLFSNKEIVKDQLYQQINNSLNFLNKTINEQYGQYSSFAFGIGVFLSVRAFNAFFVWPIIWLGVLVFNLFKRLNYFKVGFKNMQKEIIIDIKQ